MEDTLSIYNKQVKLTDENRVVGTGYLPRRPDLRDFYPENDEILQLSKKIGIDLKKKSLSEFKLPTKIDFRDQFTEVEDQGSLGSCTANATVGIVEYYQKKLFKKATDASKLFVYKTTRNLMGVTGDTGAWLRTAMGSIALCGVPPEKYWPYNIANFDVEPPAFIYSIADNFEAMKYFCHDPYGMNTPTNIVMESMKTYLCAGIPSMFGFWGFDSFENTDTKGGIPFPCSNEQVKWGHAIVAAGYDDNLKIKNTLCNKVTKGAFIIRNSWGKRWGEDGYGYIPYEYFLKKLALDAWSLISSKWIDTGKFNLG